MCARVKRMPVAASLSMCGVISGARPPKQPGESQPRSSAVRSRMLGRSPDRGRDFEKHDASTDAAAPAPRPWRNPRREIINRCPGR